MMSNYASIWFFFFFFMLQLRSHGLAEAREDSPYFSCTSFILWNTHLVHDQIWWLLPVQNHSFTFCEPVTICGHSSHSAQCHSQRMIFALRAILACFPRIGANCEGLFVASHLCPFGLCVSYCRWQRGSAVCFAVRLQFFSFVFCSRGEGSRTSSPRLLWLIRWLPGQLGPQETLSQKQRSTKQQHTMWYSKGILDWVWFKGGMESKSVGGFLCLRWHLSMWISQSNGFASSSDTTKGH